MGSIFWDSPWQCKFLPFLLRLEFFGGRTKTLGQDLGLEALGQEARRGPKPHVGAEASEHPSHRLLQRHICRR